MLYVTVTGSDPNDEIVLSFGYIDGDEKRLGVAATHLCYHLPNLIEMHDFQAIAWLAECLRSDTWSSWEMSEVLRFLAFLTGLEHDFKRINDSRVGIIFSASGWLDRITNVVQEGYAGWFSVSQRGDGPKLMPVSPDLRHAAAWMQAWWCVMQEVETDGGSVEVSSPNRLMTIQPTTFYWVPPEAYEGPEAVPEGVPGVPRYVVQEQQSSPD